MTTFQLREICNKEKLVKSIINPLDKEELIRLIMKYRGEKESKLIKNYLVGGIERVERFLSRSNKEEINNRYIDYPGKITIYESLALEIYDNYILRSSEKLEEGNVLLVDSNYKICTIFNVKKLIQNNKEEYYLIKGESIEARESESKHYSLLFFRKRIQRLFMILMKETI